MGFLEKLFGKKNKEEIEKTIKEAADNVEKVGKEIIETVDKDLVNTISETVEETKEESIREFNEIKKIFVDEEDEDLNVKKKDENLEAEERLAKDSVAEEKFSMEDEEEIKNNEEKIAMRLTKTKEGFFSKLKSIFVGKSKITEDVYEELEDLLIQSDIGFNMTKKIMFMLEKEVISQKVTDTEQVYEIVKKILSDFLVKENTDLKITDSELNVILVVGVNGVGKTTTIGKIAAKYSQKGKKVILAAADTFRAAAVEQLEEWSNRAGAKIIKGKPDADPASVAYEALDVALEENFDILIIDTAGRLHNKANLMRELEKINNTIKKKIGDRYYESILVLDATTGQNGINQAKEFNEVTDLTGFILTKLDGTAKGGIVFAVSEELKKPIKFIGVGEKINDLLEFSPEEFINAIFDK